MMRTITGSVPPPSSTVVQLSKPRRKILMLNWRTKLCRGCCQLIQRKRGRQAGAKKNEELFSGVRIAVSFTWNESSGTEQAPISIDGTQLNSTGFQAGLGDTASNPNSQ